MKVNLRVVAGLHKLILLNEEGDFTSWLITSVLFTAYLGFSLALVNVFGTDVIYAFTRFSHDNLAHLYIARTVVDNGAYSRLSNVGIVWLPLYHLTIMFLTPINPLYVTGLAGSIFNSLFIAASATTIYLLVGGVEGALMGFAFGASTYSIIHATSSYMVPEGIFLTLGGLLYFRRYLRDDDFQSLVKSAAFMMLASITRYESWLVLGSMWLAVVLRECVARRRCHATSFFIPSLLGIAGWVAYNYVIFGNPIEFITHPSPGARGYYFMIISRVMHPWWTDIHGIFNDLLMLAGPVIPLVVLGALAIIRRRDWSLCLVLASPFILLLSEGKGLAIADHPLYFYFTSPFLFILGGEGTHLLVHAIKSLKTRHKEALKVGLAGFLIVSYVLFLGYGYAVLGHQLREAAPSRYAEELRSVTTIMRAWGGEGLILCSNFIHSERISVLGGVSPANIVDEFDEPFFSKVSAAPWRYGVSVVILPKDYASLRAGLVGLDGYGNYVTRFYENLTWRSEFLTNYTLVGETSKVLIYGSRGFRG
ncbi:MAG: hypothetical protein J7L55_03745 [Desulfurococcales archaeon]|nr:hypothetical protein [Desulfurococcales archaeon]